MSDVGRAARLYYEHDLTHREIAELLGLSRIKVTRLLAKAREQGIVKITIDTDDTLFEAEETALRQRFGIQRAWLAPSGHTPEKTAENVAAVGRRALNDLLSPGLTIAIALSATLSSVISGMEARQVAILAVPATGMAMGAADGSSAMELALQLARRTGGRALTLPAPLLAPDVDSARLLMDQPGIQRTLEVAANADLIVAGLGDVRSPRGLLGRLMDGATIAELEAGGAVGDIGARFFDSEGHSVKSGLSPRFIGLSFEEILRIPRRLAISSGSDRVRAISTALERGVVTMLATDVDTAREVLGQPTG